MEDSQDKRAFRFEQDRSINMANQNLEKLLKTPQFKDQFVSALLYLEPEKAREMARILLWTDSAFSFGVIGQFSKSFNFAIAFLDEMGRQLQKVPAHLLRQFAVEMGKDLDFESVRALPQAFSPVFENIGLTAGKDPETINRYRERRIALLQKAFRTADFGKIRRKITDSADINYPVIESAVTAIISDPVIFANLINIIPPLINNLLKGSAKALGNIDYPPEILASAVFNLIDDIEFKEIALIINETSALINKLHDGSAVLGQNEPRFKAVMQRLCEKVLSDLDLKEAAAALAALGEDLEAVFSISADMITQKPELVEELLPALIRALGSGIRGLSSVFEQFNLMPAQHLQGLTVILEQGFYTELANLINLLIKMSNRAWAENPILLEKAFKDLYFSLDKQEIGRLFSNCLVSYNHLAADEADQLKADLSLCLANVDQQELTRALLLTSERMSEVLIGNPKLSRSLLKSFFRVLRALIRGSLRR